MFPASLQVEPLSSSNADKLSTTSNKNEITTLIFDVDDTLYDAGTGFAAHRNTEVAHSFMIECLHFPDLASAEKIRNEYFAKYHSMAKALQVAEKEGKLPFSDKKFDPKELAEWMVVRLNFSLLGGVDRDLVQLLKSCPLNLVAFSNGPRKYVKRVLSEIGLEDVFHDDVLFAVDDVLPHCKPEMEAFDVVFQKMGIRSPEECVMIEDSMKNVRVAKKLGMKTVLVTGRKDGMGTLGTEKTKMGDDPKEDDPAVDVCIEHVAQMKDKLPGLWSNPAVFES